VPGTPKNCKKWWAAERQPEFSSKTNSSLDPVVTKRKERTMPHVVVKLWPGKSEQQRNQLADKIVKDVLQYGEELVSVAIEEVKPQDWTEKVYKPDDQNKWEKLYKKPGYEPSE
jgi:4-oxalocrotonate tautomerase